MEKADKLYQKAKELAAAYHAGQTDKGGNPYIEHVCAVAENVNTIELKIIAMLHDILEDTVMTREGLEKEGFPENIIEAVCILTHEEKETASYEEYILKVRENEMARAVKIADLKNNMNLKRIPNPTAADYERCEKYARALKCLQS